MKKYHVYGVGNALVDMEVTVNDEFLRRMGIGKGHMTLVDERRQIELLANLDHRNGKWASGGSAANTIIAVNYFGGQSYYSCKVANDEAGDFYVADLRAAGVDSNINGVLYEGITGHCLVMITPDAERTMNTFLGITDSLSVEELDTEAIRSSQYVYLEGYLVSSSTSRETAIEARNLAQNHGVKTALTFSDPSMITYFRDGMTEMVGDGVDLLFCNEAEALGWAQTEDLDFALDKLSDIAKSYAVTLGAKGAVVYDGHQQIEISPHPVKAIDSNGAGDMFAGAFLYGITHGHAYETAGKIASLASARVVSRFGPRLPAEEHKNILAETLELIC
ncbi:MAG: adenosine kinase [Pseudomonadota bacterium]